MSTPLVAKRALWIYYDSAGTIRFSANLQEGLEPQALDGLQCMQVPPDTDLTHRAVEGGQLVDRIVDNDLPLRQARARAKRDQALLASDWTQSVRDNPLSSAEIELWAAYRDALRAWPDQPGWPDIEMPHRP